MKMKARFFALFVAMVSVGLASPLIRLASAPPVVVATYRMTISAIIFLPFLVSSHKRKVRLPVRDLLSLLLPAALLSLHFILWISSLSYTSVLASTVLVTTNPIFVPIFSYLIFREKTKRSLFLGIIVAFAGSVLIGVASHNAVSKTTNFGNLLALLGAMAVSLYLLVTRRLRKKFDLLSYVSVVYLFSSVILILFSLVMRQKIFGYSPRTYFYLFLIALVPQVIGHTLYNWSLKYFSPSFIAVTILGEPVFAAIFAFILLKETPLPLEIAGAVVIMLGIYLSTRAETA